MKKARSYAVALLLALTLLTNVGFAEGTAATIVCDDEKGYWLYETQSLRVEIKRCTFADPLVWYEADVITSQASPLRGYLSAENQPQQHLKKPATIATEQQLVFAMTDDYFAARIGKRKKKVGVIIRDGTLLYDSVYQGNGRPFPILDTMALYPDGGMEVYRAREHTGAEYLAMGATDVFSFGPLLIRDGVIDDRLQKYYTHLEPRTTIGCIAPNHYVAIVVDGRQQSSRGCGLQRIAERMLELGVTDAINMDGGQTAALLFLGKQINITGSYKGHSPKVRSVNGLIGVKDAAWTGAP